MSNTIADLDIRLGSLTVVALLAVIVANFWMKFFDKSLQKPYEGRENKTSDVKKPALTSTNLLFFEGKESSAVHVKTGFLQNDIVSMTRSLKICRKL